MKKIILQTLAALVFAAASASAVQVNLYVDTAPNVYGSPNWPAWWTQAKADAASDSFVNMASSVNPLNAGTKSFELEDMVVYSFGDLGHRLHFLYWVPNETISSLSAKNFQIAMDYVWEGVTYDFYNDYYGTTWLTPSSWEEYAGGVIGSAGFAWWGAYNVNTPEALAADLAAWRPYVGDVTLHVRMDDQPIQSLVAHHNTPEAGTTLALLGFAVVGLGALRRRLSV